jgi:hypothetical protein
MRKYLITLILVAALTSQAGAALIAAYNETASSAVGTYGFYSIGWLWDAPTDFSLTRIETRFGSGSKHVTIAVYDDLPQSGGTLLGSAEYDAVGGLWGGADMGSILMAAGQDYLISFWNVVDLGTNFTEDAGAELFGKDHYIYYDIDSDPPPSFLNSYFWWQSNAIIRIYGDPVPEPATIAMLGLGVLGLVRRKK